VIDSSGAAKLYECTNTNHTIYDANQCQHAPDGYILRSVFGISGSEPTEGVARYYRARHLLECYTQDNPLNVRFILQTLARDFSLSSDSDFSHNDPYPLPYYGFQDTLPIGCVITEETINRYKTRSCSVIRGVLPGENPLLSTTYAMLGQPVLSLAVPLWVGSEYVPYCLRGRDQAPWYSIIAQRMSEIYPYDNDNGEVIMNSHYLLDSLGNGVYTWSLNLEDWGLDEAESKLEIWRQTEFNTLDIRQGEIEIANDLWNGFASNENLVLTGADKQPPLPDLIKAYNYPNPFNISTNIDFSLPQGTDGASVSVNVYTITGERVISLNSVLLDSGNGRASWDGKNESGEVVSSGMYFYRIESPDYSVSGKMLLIK